MYESEVTKFNLFTKMLNFKIFGIIFLQYSSFKYYTFCNEKNDSLVLGGPSMNLGPEIRRKTVEVDTCGKDLTTVRSGGSNKS